MFLNRSRFVSRATIELNRALELSLRFARHPSIETSFFSSLFPSKSVFSFFFLYELYTKYRITDYITIYKRRIYINFDRGRRFETREELATNRRYSDDCFLPSYEFVYSWEDWLEKKKRTRDFIFILDPFSSSTEPRTNFQPNGATRIKRKDNETDAWF